MVENNDRHVKFKMGGRRGQTFRIGFNHIAGALERRTESNSAVFVEIAEPTGVLGVKYGTISVDEAKQVIAKLQEVVDHYENYRPVDALGLGAVVDRYGAQYINIGGYWTGVSESGNGVVSHNAINDWMKMGVAIVQNEGYKSGGDN